jgi:hypothetical protein
MGEMGDKLCSYSVSHADKWFVHVYDYASYFLGFDFHNCPYCEGVVVPKGNDEESAILGLCEECGFWRLIDVGDIGGFHNGRQTAATISTVKEYAVSDTRAPIDDLRRFLQARPKYMRDVDPHAFELLIRDCLRSVYQDCEIRHVGGTGDGGVDLKIVRGGNDHILVQVKRRRDLEAHESVDVVRSLNGVLFREGAAKGMVVTTAADFTRAAKMEAAVKTPTAEEYQMILHGFPDIVSWLNLPSQEPYEPWRVTYPHWNFIKPLYSVPGKVGYMGFK